MSGTGLALDVMVTPRPLRQMGDIARRAEAAGFATMFLTEAGRTACLSCAAAAVATTRLGLGTGVAVAFPRSPMVTATIAWELAEATGGRFVLGLGTQVRAHVERRYSAAFDHPGPRLAEYVEAVHAIFRAFRGDERLDFRGDFYSFSLLPAAWSPGRIDCPDPPVYVSAVGPWMHRMAGAHCDGVHVHPFHSVDHLRDVQVPQVASGATGAGRSLDDVVFEIPVMTGVGATEEEIARTREQSRAMVAFYGSTPGYDAVFAHHGYEGLGARLNELQRAGDVRGMVALVTDDVLDHYVVSAPWEELAVVLRARYAGVAPRVRLMTYTANTQLASDPDVFDRWADVGRALAAG
jgi:probable F420-dependent oxidoreductase